MTTDPILQGIHLGDTLHLIRRAPSSSVDLIFTSPWYPGRPGGVHPDEFVAWWLPFAHEFWRVLKSTGSLVLNIKEPVIDGQRHTCVSSLTTAMRSAGWYYVEEYIWAKPDPLPGQYGRRLKDGFERLLHFSVQPACNFHPDSVRQPTRRIAQKRATVDDLISRPRSLQQQITPANFADRPLAYPSNVLYIPTAKKNHGHPAVFPEKLPEFFIKLLTQEGDLVLEPFLGSGTTVAVAKRLGRRFIGFEKEKHYFKIAQRRIANVTVGVRDATAQVNAAAN